MANEFANAQKVGVTTVQTVYTAAAGKTCIMLELDIANTTSAVVEASVQMLDKSVNANYATGGRHIVKNAPVPAGGSLMVIAGQKIVLEPTDIVKVTATGAVDVVAAILEDVNP